MKDGGSSRWAYGGTGKALDQEVHEKLNARAAGTSRVQKGEIMDVLSIIGLVIGLALAVICLLFASEAETSGARVAWIVAAPLAILVGIFLAVAVLVIGVGVLVLWAVISFL